MRLRLTLILIFANIALFTSMWLLEREPATTQQRVANTITFTTIEISGKGINEPRILKLENNGWHITSPISWRANNFAVNRIRNQIEFLERGASFPLSELKTRNYKLSDYGLDVPMYTIKYGNDKKMYTLKIGKPTSVGGRIYLLDEDNEKIVVVDKEFVDGLVVDVERLRNQNIFDISQYEVMGFSVRLPSKESSNLINGNFRRIGLVRDGTQWKLETPIVALADSNVVREFLAYILSLPASGFSKDSTSINTGFDVSALPITLTLEGINRRQVLLLGKKTENGTQVYAKLEGNPTVFTLNASILDRLSNMQTTLRDKMVARFDMNKVSNMTIFNAGKILKFEKGKDGSWGVIDENSKESGVLYDADPTKINKILMELSTARVEEFVSDAPGEDVEKYGITPNSLCYTLYNADDAVLSLVVGKKYTSRGKNLVYAKTKDSNAIVGISDNMVSLAKTNVTDYRLRVLETLPNDAKLKSLVLTELKTGKVLMILEMRNGEFDLSKLSVRTRSAAKKMIDYAKQFVVRKYLSGGFNEEGALAVGKVNPWVYELKANYEKPVDAGQPSGEKSLVNESTSWLLTKRVGGLTQYGGSRKKASTFFLEYEMIDSIFEFTQKSIEDSELKKPEAVAPKKK